MSSIINDNNKYILCVGMCVLDIIQVCSTYPEENSDKRFTEDISNELYLHFSLNETISLLFVGQNMVVGKEAATHQIIALY